ncbi:hypothetical protein GCM10009641_35640 [Mycobacterium cookii]|uniref:Uncharacterized protein n=1 Tax=Nocardioides furvisabuli TaxID=375542 RepID=A0ABP5IN08_9ACTN|nr:DUF6049 family protein [Nocardioides furvisabuli]
MPRPSSFRAALAGLLTLGAVTSGASAPAYAAPAEESDPLVVHLDTISPELPRTGDVEITGTVTNVSDETFTRINLHAFSSQAPIPTTTALAESVTIDPAEYVGQRVTVPGTFDTVDELAPGETASFADSVPVELLEIPDEEGVYWIGIHALGDSSVPRDSVADGRARTFIPREPSRGATQEASVILSIRGRVWYSPDGRISGTDRWARRLEEGGSLDAALDMADSAGDAPYSWLVDPAVLVALRRLALGNPARSIAPDDTVPGQEPTPTEPPTDEPPTGSTPEPAETLTPPPTGTDASAPTDDEVLLAAAADAWLARFSATASSRPVLALPFGDLDVSAAVRHDPVRYDQAVVRSAEVMTALGLPSQPAVSPAADRLSPEAIARVSTDTVILLGDNAFVLPPTTPHSVVRLLGHKVVVTSTGAEAGGPGPTAATDPLALRQRLLSEAALRLAADDTAPVVVTLPTVWRGEDAASFFSRLDRPWLDLVPVTEVAERGAVGVKASNLSYTELDQEAELDAVAFAAATRATDASALLERVLTLQTTIELQVREEVLVALSEQHRARPRLALRATGRVEEALEDDLAKITVEAPTAVTLSSDAGPFPTTVVNGLDQPVTVQVRATTDGELTVTGDGERELGPRARSVIRYEATAARAGVHSVRLVVTSVDGEPLGSSDVLPVRAARVSALIWIVMALGALVLFGMIGYRLPGQIRQRRAELAAAEAAAEPADAQPTTAGTGPAPERA